MREPEIPCSSCSPIQPANTATGWSIGWGFTAKCDMSCAFCYSASLRKGMKDDFALPLARSFLSANSGHIAAVNFGTGELFQASPYMDILSLCRELLPAARVAVTTNGQAADLAEERLAKVLTLVDEWDVSIDFADPQRHDASRGRTGTWDRAVQTLERTTSAGALVTIVTVGTPHTLQPANLEALFRLCEQFNTALRINLYMPVQGRMEFFPDTALITGALEQLGRWSSALSASDPLLNALLGRKKHRTINRTCRLLPDGRITPSTYLFDPAWIAQKSIVNLDLDSLLQLPAFSAYQHPPVPAECRGCLHESSCAGGSVERRWLVNHSLHKRDPLCPGSHAFSMIAQASSTSWEGPSVHLGYLPTLVALPPHRTGRND